MKLKILTPLFFFCLFSNCLFASFPVERSQSLTNKVENANVQTTVVSDNANLETTFSAVMSNQKSQGIALILALTLGLLAGHRWYLGTPKALNYFFILTFGGLGLWLLIDIIRIATGGMNPKGRYKKSFF